MSMPPGHPRRSAVASLKREHRGIAGLLLRRHPRRSAVASLKRNRRRDAAELVQQSSTAISRGLIEAARHAGSQPPARRHPRRSAVASLKRRGPQRIRPLSRRHPRRSAVASLKRCNVAAMHCSLACHPRRSAVASLKRVEELDDLRQLGRSSTAISRGLIEAAVDRRAPVGRGRVIHGDQPWPH